MDLEVLPFGESRRSFFYEETGTRFNSVRTEIPTGLFLDLIKDVIYCPWRLQQDGALKIGDAFYFHREGYSIIVDVEDVRVGMIGDGFSIPTSCKTYSELIALCKTLK